MSVIIVGSSHSLNSLNLGETIDSYDRVVRVNWFPTSEPFHSRIGKKQDILVYRARANFIDTHRQINTERNRKANSTMSLNEVLLIDCPQAYESTLEYTRGMFKPKSIKNATVKVTEFLKKHRISIDSLAGIQAIIAAHLHTKKPVDIVGFHSERSEYYWSDELQEKASPYRHAQQPDELKKLQELKIIGKILDA